MNHAGWNLVMSLSRGKSSSGRVVILTQTSWLPCPCGPGTCPGLAGSAFWNVTAPKERQKPRTLHLHRCQDGSMVYQSQRHDRMNSGVELRVRPWSSPASSEQTPYLNNSCAKATRRVARLGCGFREL